MFGNNAHITLSCVFLLLAVLIQTGTSLNCYDCMAIGKDNACTRANVPNPQIQCPEPQVCVYHWIPAGDVAGLGYSEKIIKGCRNSDYCDVGLTVLENKAGLTRETRTCKTCKADLCNMDSAASVVIPTFTGFIMLLVLKHFF